MSGAVLMTLPSAKPAALTYADAMVRDLNRAAQNSLTRGEPYGFGMTQAGYTVYAFREEAWEAVNAGAPAGKIDAVLTIEGRKAKLPETAAPIIVFEPTGMNVPFSVLLTGDQARLEITANGAGAIEMVQR